MTTITPSASMTPTTGPDIERVPFVTPSRLADAERRVFDEACAAIMDGSAFRMSGGWSDTAAQLFAETIGLGEDTAGWAVSMFRSGTDALVRALLACGVQPGDRVAMPDLAFHAVAGSVLMIGAQPVPIDINADDWCIDAGALEATCPAGSVTAVIAVDNYGTPCDLAALARVTRRIDARLIVDACESLGSSRPGGPVASHADSVVVSFSFTKPIHAAGMGGALAVRRELITHYDPVRWTDGQCALPELNAAHLVLAWPSLDANIERLRRTYARYSEVACAAGLGVQIERGVSTRIHAPVLLPQRLAGRRDELLGALDAAGISCRAQFTSQSELLGLMTPPPVSKAVSDRVLSLPTGAGLPARSVEHVARTVEDVLGRPEFAERP